MYSEKDYKGEFNILKEEKALLLTGLTKTQNYETLSKLLGISTEELIVKLFRHRLISKIEIKSSPSGT
jgi:hypothetical protein